MQSEKKYSSLLITSKHFLFSQFRSSVVMQRLKCSLSWQNVASPPRSKQGVYARSSPTLLFIGPFDQLPRKAATQRGSPKLDVAAAAAVKNQRHKTERQRERETSDFKIDVLTFRPRGSIFVQTVIVHRTKSQSMSSARLLLNRQMIGL